ncbi:MAG: tRNA (adenosine(37)-N6)-threonylcarbamoyltransferase complex ATPase subunit type 1 TsaE [bacterium]|nr:tRNA (adenosine(37)-N6)-threonylcarbamoyltransferase complex ATPase subunit type 1 TsaE [bacterium]
MIKAQSYNSKGPEATFAFGKQLAADISGGEIFALYGDLGAGKTAFVQGLAAGLGVTQTVNSPTFPIMNIYKLKHKKIKSLCHIDTYRLTDGNELTAIGALDYIGAVDTVTAIEWAEKATALLPKIVINVKFETISEIERKIIIN